MKSHVRDVKFWSFLMKTKWTFFYQKYFLAICSWCKILLNPNETFLQVYFFGILKGSRWCQMFSASASKQSHLFHNLDKGSMQLQNWMNFCSFSEKLQIFLPIVNMILTLCVAMKIKKHQKQFSILSELCNMFLQNKGRFLGLLQLLQQIF